MCWKPNSRIACVQYSLVTLSADLQNYLIYFVRATSRARTSLNIRESIVNCSLIWNRIKTCF